MIPYGVRFYMSKIPAIKVLSPFGLKGYTKIISFISTDNLHQIKSFSTSSGIIYNVEDLNTNGRVAKIKFVGIDTPEDVAMLTNEELMIDSDELPELNDDEIYLFKLVDNDVIFKGKKFGLVHSVQNFGAGDLLEIAILDENAEIKDTVFVPFSKECILIKDDNTVELTDFCYDNYF